MVMTLEGWAARRPGMTKRLHSRTRIFGASAQNRPGWNQPPQHDTALL